uniref:SH2 domain-containing protein n=1 Tax=Timema bartmani TaxID=61472 RepID=A0A7R9FAI3_9NEOP|nr:unnamed protein product [Timema bartmani]
MTLMCFFCGVKNFPGERLQDKKSTNLPERQSEPDMFIDVDGAFLVRESNTAAGDYVLSLLHEGEKLLLMRGGIKTFHDWFCKMKAEHSMKMYVLVWRVVTFIYEQTIIHGLETLIEYYQGESHGLATKLNKVCKKDTPPHDSRRHGRTNLLHRATKEGNYTVVSELLKCGYRSLEAKNQDGQTAVHLASRMGKDDILKKLIESGANINCRDTAGYTPLHTTSFLSVPHDHSLDYLFPSIHCDHSLDHLFPPVHRDHSPDHFFLSIHCNHSPDHLFPSIHRNHSPDHFFPAIHSDPHQTTSSQPSIVIPHQTTSSQPSIVIPHQTTSSHPSTSITRRITFSHPSILPLFTPGSQTGKEENCSITLRSSSLRDLAKLLNDLPIPFPALLLHQGILLPFLSHQGHPSTLPLQDKVNPTMS